MSLSLDDVRALAALARIALTPDEEAALAVDLRGVLALAEALDGVDLAEVPPTTHPAEIPSPRRADRPGPVMPREAVLGPAADRDGDLVLVPAVLPDPAP